MMTMTMTMMMNNAKKKKARDFERLAACANN